jgi:hypothetical protein
MSDLDGKLASLFNYLVSEIKELKDVQMYILKKIERMSSTTTHEYASDEALEFLDSFNKKQEITRSSFPILGEEEKKIKNNNSTPLSMKIPGSDKDKAAFGLIGLDRVGIN